MASPLRILVVDDDPTYLRVTEIGLETAGMECATATNGELGLGLLEREGPGAFDAVLLDVEMPECGGWELLLRVRERGDEVPILFVTGRDSLEERVRGLRLGADDYIVKPAEFDEVLARIEAVVRRRRALPTLQYGSLTLDLARRRVARAGNSVDLSPREYDLLLALVQAEGQVVSRTELLREVWDMDFDPETNVIDVHIGRVRKKLGRFGASCIETVRGEGYRVVQS